MQIAYYTSPMGILEIKEENNYIASIKFVNNKKVGQTLNKTLKLCIKQLDQYFNNNRRSFDIRTSQKGTSFQKKVWEEIQKISYGKTITYKELANKINNPKAYRAVGGALNKNKIAIIIPCHRIISTKGLGGYAAGLNKKNWLLKHEKK
ncbi:methylated-DNA--[protein]-cysteine S-methyltransferase [Candidatus Woesearchaeota archaeon]|nr:methylated-DNA--[protein]-cysteine S-methyltransferase [Candidatus Woesearchaeota archaeon]